MIGRCGIAAFTSCLTWPARRSTTSRLRAIHAPSASGGLRLVVALGQVKNRPNGESSAEEPAADTPEGEEKTKGESSESGGQQG